MNVKSSWVTVIFIFILCSSCDAIGNKQNESTVWNAIRVVSGNVVKNKYVKFAIATKMS